MWGSEQSIFTTRRRTKWGRKGVGSISANQYYSWQSGPLHTLHAYTDPRGLQVTLTWDNLSRVIGVSYPDGTTISNRYTALDLTSTKDRLGNWSSYAHNGVRRKERQTADGRKPCMAGGWTAWLA